MFNTLAAIIIVSMHPPSLTKKKKNYLFNTKSHSSHHTCNIYFFSHWISFNFMESTITKITLMPNPIDRLSHCLLLVYDNRYIRVYSTCVHNITNKTKKQQFANVTNTIRQMKTKRWWSSAVAKNQSNWSNRWSLAADFVFLRADTLNDTHIQQF